MVQRHDDVFAMDEIRGEIGFVFGFIDVEIGEFLGDDGSVMRDKERRAG